MERERLEINGKALDLNDGERLSLALTSNLIKGLDDYTTCYTYSYTVPNTPRNRSILGELLIPGADSKKVRQYVKASYQRDGVQILDGNVVVTGATLDSISLSMLFGQSALQALIDDDKNIYELNWPSNGNTITVDENGDQTGLTYQLYDETRTLPPFWLMMNEFFYPSYEKGSTPRMPVVCKVQTILDRIAEDYGLTIGLDAGDDLLQFAPTWRKYSSAYETANQIAGTLMLKGDYWLAVAYNWTVYGSNIDEDVDVKDRPTHCAKRLYAEATITKIAITYTADSKRDAYLYAVVNPDLTFHTCLDKNNQPRTSGDAFIGMVEAGKTAVFEKTPADLNIPDEFDKLEIAIISKDDVQRSAYGATINVDVDLELDYTEADQGKFLAGNCLPEISTADFLTQYAAVRFGKFPVNSLKGGTTVNFKSLEDVAAATPYDWTDRLLDGDISHEWTMDDLAQKNYFNFADDDSEPCYDEAAFDVEIDTNDETLDAETDFSECSFSYNYRPAGSDRMLTYYEGKEVNPAPRLVQVNADIIQGNPWSSSDNNQYASYETVPLYWKTSGTYLECAMWEPAVLTCSVQLDTVDLLTLDLARPVYFKQFGKLYYIDSLDVDGDNVAKCKLIEVKTKKS